MDTKVADTMSDSDSGSSTGSWVFVDENNPPDVNAPNQFYLNCSGEPVQELTENDLGVVDCDSDSDGISVISETEESLRESSSDDLTQEFFVSAGAQTSDDVVENVGSSIAATERVIQLHDNSINLRKLFITSSLIGAGVVVVAILIAPYITPKADSNISVDDVSVDMPKKYHTRPKDLHANLHCQREHKKRRLTVSFPTADSNHNDSKKYNKREVFGIRSGDNKSYFENDYQVKHAHKTDNIKHANAVEREDDEQEVLFVSQSKKSKKRNKDRGLGCEHEVKSKEEKLKAKEEYLARKEEYLIKKEYELLQKKVKLEKKLSKILSKSDPKCVKHKKSGRKENKSDGSWYLNFQKNREDSRKRERMADWLFERANDRTKRRDEARWYFHWMVGREQGRFRRPVKRQHA